MPNVLIQTSNEGRGDVCGEELHLLHHAALDDLVVAVQPQRQAFAIQDFLLYLLFDQALLAEGGQLDDPASFVRRINHLMLEMAA